MMNTNREFIQTLPDIFNILEFFTLVYDTSLNARTSSNQNTVKFQHTHWSINLIFILELPHDSVCKRVMCYLVAKLLQIADWRANRCDTFRDHSILL
jgi:hypothetical protein